jgi:tetratricopeptide (TPR) repeat protein
MPARFPFYPQVLAALLSGLAVLGAVAADKPAGSPFITNSRLDRQLLEQLLTSELELRSGDFSTAYQGMLAAARRTHEEQLYRRAADIAVQAHAGEDALAAVRQWRSDLPQSLDAHRYLIQLLVVLNRVPETTEPITSLIRLTPADERNALMANVSRFFARSGDRKQVAGVVEEALKPFADLPESRGAVSVGVGRAWLAAQEPARALESLRRAQEQDPTGEAPVVLALEMLPGTPAAEAIVTSHLQARPSSNAVRMAYARVLTSSQRFPDAIKQLDAVTRNDPKLMPPWLTLGALYLELRQPKEATAALLRFVDLAENAPAAAPPTTPQAAAPADDDEGAPSPDRSLTQAWLMLSQAAEQQGDFKAAERWLGKVDNPQRALEVLSRRASLMAKQGKLKDARELIRKAPEKGEDDARAKVLAEVQLLRDAKQWGEANNVLAGANQKYPDDVDMLYEQSMMAEKLNRLEEMERLLRRVIALKPDHPHAHNALGYSLAERNVRLPEAKALIQKALELAPGEPFITDSLGWVEFRMGNREEALRLLRGAYHSRPDPEIAAHLGEVLWVSGQRDEARRVWREGRSRDSANDVLRETLARLRVDL